MKIFISWSGERSKHIALTFRRWLQRLSPALDPWMSTVDIQKGFSWDSVIAQELNDSKVGLICLTSDNLSSTFLHYEAGAISNVPGSNVYTFLYGVDDTDVHQPLSRFQNTKFTKDDILQLVRDINFKLKELKEIAWSSEALEQNFELLYPSLEVELNKTPAETAPKAERTAESLLEEVLRTVRGIKSPSPKTLESPKYYGGTSSTPPLNVLLLDFIREWHKRNSAIPLDKLQEYVDEVATYILSRGNSDTISKKEVEVAITHYQIIEQF